MLFKKVWDSIVASEQAELLSRANSNTDKEPLLASASSHSGDWLQSPLITAVGLDNETIRVAGYRLGLRTCEHHTCACGKQVDSRGLHVLSCCKSARRQQDLALNDIIWRDIKRTPIPAIKERLGLCTDGKRLDDDTNPVGQREAISLRCHNTWAASHLNAAGAAANCAATAKTSKCVNITSTHIFTLIVIETAGSWNQEAIEIIEDIGNQITSVTDDENEITYLFQRTSI